MSLRKALKTAGIWLGKTFDVRDAMLASGLVLLSIGLWQISAPLALIVPGAIITAFAIFANRIDGNAGEG
jgi:cytosine/uracil/thiamine/allantoin permease